MPVDSALTLARLRANRTVPLDGRLDDRLVAFGADVGRRVLVAPGADSARLVFGWLDGVEPDPDAIALHQPKKAVLATFGVCLGLCWPADAPHPHPGEPTGHAAVLACGERIGMHPPFVTSALRSELALGGLIDYTPERITLGPTVAAWSRQQVDTMRDFAHIFRKAAGR